MTLTKADLVQQIYQNHEGVTKTQAMEAVEAFLRISKDTLTGGSDLLLSGFGKFNVKKKSPRKGRNPQTGNELILEARTVVTFHPSGTKKLQLRHFWGFFHRTPTEIEPSSTPLLKQGCGGVR